MPLPVACLIACLMLFSPPVRAAGQDWLLTIDRWGTAEYRTLSLATSGDRVSGTYEGQALLLVR